MNIINVKYEYSLWHKTRNELTMWVSEMFSLRNMYEGTS